MTTSSPAKPPVRKHALSLDRSGGANAADAPGANINTILAQYRRHGTLPVVSQKNPLYGDFTFPDDITAVREAVHQAEDRFNELPAAIRTLSNNDWVQFLELFNDESKRPQLEAAGLIITPDEPIIPTNTPNAPSLPPVPAKTPPTPPDDQTPASSTNTPS